MQQLTSKAQAHSALCVIPRDTNILSLKCRQYSQETAINEQMEKKKKHPTKLIYPLQQNVEIRHMPKGIYYFNIAQWLDDVRILMLSCILLSENAIDTSPALIKHSLLFFFFCLTSSSKDGQRNALSNLSKQ